MESKSTTQTRQHQFSFIESVASETPDALRGWRFRQVFDDLSHLELWMQENKIENNWTLMEKLAFLRNVEANIRTGAAVRRTQLAWITVAAGTLAAILGFIIGINS